MKFKSLVEQVLRRRDTERNIQTRVAAYNKIQKKLRFLDTKECPYCKGRMAIASERRTCVTCYLKYYARPDILIPGHATPDAT